MAYIFIFAVSCLLLVAVYPLGCYFESLGFDPDMSFLYSLIPYGFWSAFSLAAMVIKLPFGRKN